MLSRLELLGAPLFVHAGPGAVFGRSLRSRQPSLVDPLWWHALTSYVASMHAAWLAFLVAGRLRHPELRVIFSMLAGLAPLHGERLASRGGAGDAFADPLTFYDTSSYDRSAVSAVREIVGAEQLLYGSDRPVVEPLGWEVGAGLDWTAVRAGSRRALQGGAVPAR